VSLLPLDEALAPIAAACALAFGLPPLLRAILARVVGSEEALANACLGASFGLATCLALASHHAIGPTFLRAPTAGWAFAALTVTASLVTLLWPCAHWVRRRTWAASPLLVGLLVGAIPAALTVAVARSTALGETRLISVDEGRAWWRVRVDPWDPSALLALAWAAQRRDETSSLAAARAAEAERLGARLSEVRTLQATLTAAQGRCDEARRLFDEALRARAREALEAGEPLDLSYPLPETLVRRCELANPSARE